MPTEYYIWNWAANDLPGHPREIVAQVAAGDFPPALQPFPIHRVHARLSQVLAAHRDEWSELHIERHAGSAYYIRVRLPLNDSPTFAQKILNAIWPAELTLYNATAHRLIGLPKHNLVEYPTGRQFVDIEVADLPGLLHELTASPGLAALACYDRDGNMFQVWAHLRQFAVEWQTLPARDFQHHRIWVAGRPAPVNRHHRLGTLENGLDLFAPELLDLAEVYELWKSFLLAPIRPPSHRWRDITHDLDQPGHPRRLRHEVGPCFGSN